MVWGAIKIFRDARKHELGHNGNIFLSGILIGGGVFNLVEGIIDHHILQLHRVRPMAENPLMYDLAFLASGVILILIGYWLKNQGQKAHD
ncbi:DUF2243 domain-containing protein [Piscibacillus salipiscarius]|nr:DUF2243 domain-containing protein [Piscibacillus salipiscarius]